MFENLGNKNFTEIILDENFRGSRCRIADIDQDNDEDIIASSNYLGEIWLWVNELSSPQKTSTWAFPILFGVLILVTYSRKERPS
jgi:hypothetical protein